MPQGGAPGSPGDEGGLVGDVLVGGAGGEEVDGGTDEGEQGAARRIWRRAATGFSLAKCKKSANMAIKHLKCCILTI